MSRANTQTEPSRREELDEKVTEKYRTVEGVEPSDASAGGNDHPIVQALGNEDHYEFEYDPRATGKSIAERYDEPAAALREYTHNAETACIRACRHKLIEETGYSEEEVVSMPIDELVYRAREETGYDPTITVRHRWPGSNDPALEIIDNGIGISVEEFLVMKKHAHSLSFLDGSVGGQFGQGIYSGFMIVGHNGVVKFKTRSRIDDASYEMRMRITGLNPMPGSRESYGTHFTFPALSEDGKEVDVGGKMAEYCRGIRIPVMYEEYDESGSIVYQDEFLPTQFEDTYDETDPVVTYETEYFRAVSSPGVTTDDRDPRTLLTSMPISRNDSRYGGTNNSKFESPWKFDIRLKYEDGRIAFGPHAGFVPVESASYERMDEDRKEHYVPKSEMVGDDVTMPKPVDDRDRLRDGHRDFFKRVSQGLSRRFAQQYAEVLSGVNDFSEIGNMEMRERTMFVRGYSHFGPKQLRSNPQNVQDKLEEEVGVTVPLDVCKKLAKMKKKMKVVPRGTDNPSKKGGRRERNRDEKRVWRLIVETEPDANVYMGKTISEKKCRLVWELDDDNYVVQLTDDDPGYDHFERLFGWKKLKDLPSRNLGEKFPQLSDEFLDQWDVTSSGSAGSGNRGGSYDRARAKKRSIKVRQGRGRGSYSTHNAETVHDKFDAGERVSCGGYRSNASELIVVDQNEHTIGDYNYLCKNEVGQAVVPTYVKEYLLEADNVYEPMEFRRTRYYDEIDLHWSDDTRSCDYVGELSENDVLFVMNDDDTIRWAVDNLHEVKRTVDEWMGGNVDEYTQGDISSFTIVPAGDMRDYWVPLSRGRDPTWESGATLLRTCSYSKLPNGIKGESFSMSDAELYLNVELPPSDFDRGSPEWSRLFGDHPTMNQTTVNLVEMLQDMDGCDGIDEPFPSTRGGE